MTSFHRFQKLANIYHLKSFNLIASLLRELYMYDFIKCTFSSSPVTPDLVYRDIVIIFFTLFPALNYKVWLEVEVMWGHAHKITWKSNLFQPNPANRNLGSLVADLICLTFKMTSLDRWWRHHDTIVSGSLLHHYLSSLKVSLQLLIGNIAK